MTQDGQVVEDELSSRRLTDQELRQRMFEAGRDLMIQNESLTVAVEGLKLEDVIRRADVPRSSASRIWPKREQFYADLLGYIASTGSEQWEEVYRQTIQLVSAVVADRLTALQTKEGRHSVLDEIIERGATSAYTAIIQSREWRMYAALTALVINADPDDETASQIAISLRAVEQRFIDRMSSFFADVAAVVGLCPRNGNDFTALSVLGTAVVEGLALRHGLTPDKASQEEASQRNKPGVLGTGFTAIIHLLVEPDPSYDATKAIGDFMKKLATSSYHQ